MMRKSGGGDITSRRPAIGAEMVQAQDLRSPGYGDSVEDRWLSDEEFRNGLVHDGRPRDEDHIAPDEIGSGRLRPFYPDAEFLLPDIVGIEVRNPQREGL